MNFSRRLLYSFGWCFFIWMVSIRTRLYNSGRRQKCSHTTGSDCNSCKRSGSIEKPLSDISGRAALPSSVIRPSRSILRHRSLFNSDHLLRGRRGQNLWRVVPSGIFLVVLSIQPKHKASSTASRYQKVLSSVGLPRLTAIQHSVCLRWFCSNHSRHSDLDLIVGRLCGIILFSRIVGALGKYVWMG